MKQKKKKKEAQLIVFPVITEERVSTGKTESCNFQFLVFLNRKNKYRKKAAIWSLQKIWGFGGA